MTYAYIYFLFAYLVLSSFTFQLILVQLCRWAGQSGEEHKGQRVRFVCIASTNEVSSVNLVKHEQEQCFLDLHADIYLPEALRLRSPFSFES